ncbi:MAG: hypothetical protein ACREQ9_03875, partial [Candidatus Binatia bacterium]
KGGDMIRALTAVIGVWLALGGSDALAAGLSPVGPLVNGEFELFLPGKGLACEVFGEDTAFRVLDPDQDPGIEDPTDPNETLPWLWLVSVWPCETGALKALQWSSSRSAQFDDHDGDGDREAEVSPGVTDPVVGVDHNFWQAYPNPQQLFTANFDALEFRVEDGAIPPSAFVQISLSTTPLETQHPFLGIFLECSLTFRSALLVPGAGGDVSVDPVTADFSSRDPRCDGAKALWDAAATDDDRRAILGRLRIVQTSFWNFNTGTSPVRLDGVSLTGATTFVEELAAGNVRVAPEEP